MVNEHETDVFSGSPMKLLKVISLLIDYPSNELFDGETLPLCREVVMTSPLISPEVRQMIAAHIDDMIDIGAMEAQTRYDGSFERGRLLSLWLFEHVHGESRDRGQAMVDLMGQYEEAGFEIGVRELPDYLPLYLEFLAYQAAKTGDEMQARIDLADVSHVIALLAARLKERQNNYLGYFLALLQVAGKPLDMINEHLKVVAAEPKDDTKMAIDQEWEEEVVDFMSAEQQDRCPSNQTQTRIAELQGQQAQANADVPVHWVGFSQAKPANPQPFIKE